MLTIEDVRQFHRVFGHPIKDSKEYLSHFKARFDEGTACYTKEFALLRLRVNLIEEEARELADAVNVLDPIETADALFDLLYVTFGAIIALGVPRSIGDEVQRSNMSKGVVCRNCHGDGAWLDYSGELKGPQHCEKCNGQGVVAIKREDGKILKGPNFSPPDIASIIERECRDWDGEANQEGREL